MTKLNQLFRVAETGVEKELLTIYLGYNQTPTIEEIEEAVRLFKSPLENKESIKELIRKVKKQHMSGIMARALSDALVKVLDQCTADGIPRVVAIQKNPTCNANIESKFEPCNPLLQNLLYGMKLGEEKEIIKEKSMYQSNRHEETPKEEKKDAPGKPLVENNLLDGEYQYEGIYASATLGQTRYENSNKHMHAYISLELDQDELDEIKKGLIEKANYIGYTLSISMLHGNEYSLVYSPDTKDASEPGINVTEEEDADSQFFKTAYEQYLKFMKDNGITPKKTLEELREELSKEDHIDVSKIMHAVKKPYHAEINLENPLGDQTKVKGMPAVKCDEFEIHNAEEDALLYPEEKPTYKKLDDLTDDEIVFLNKKMVKMFDEGANLDVISLSLFGSNPYESCVAFLKGAANKYTEECKKRGVSNSGIQPIDSNSPLYRGLGLGEEKAISKRKAKNKRYWQNKKNKSKNITK